ncbi:hypothetical protein LSH36_107g07017 [Paralvinella palmiformis]|uniref:Chorein N-terminal domain-containing protein n=1 Tax=Paralvinella palmiformis TaxID=53620 RepID=A0AAD9JZJ8_9ANNE|nr:hypothetical protein LSH36_107g07017 [Paralvinella palmiformis]
MVNVLLSGITYNAEKEEKTAWDNKQKELQRIEEAKKAEAEKNKPKEEKQDTFAEKLATNIIKNLQIEISNIHVRYEDRFTNPAKPVSIGVTLRQLSFQTTDENWTPMVIKESVSKIYKMIKLDSLALYWNSNSPSYLGLDKQQMMVALQQTIAGSGQKSDYQYLLEPDIIQCPSPASHQTRTGQLLNT